MLKLVFNCLFHKRLKNLESDVVFYSGKDDYNDEKISLLQVNKFNKVWKKAYKNIPFYIEWKAKYALPDLIENLSELKNFPILTKKDISDNRNLIAKTPSKTRETLTGGTSGISTPFPMNNNDANTAWVNTFTGRVMNGIKPRSKLFMIWGHSHLFQGKKGWVKRIKRIAADKLNNINRVSAYDLSDKNLKHITKKLVHIKPDYVIGYGSCLVALANYCTQNGINIKSAGVKRVINTSETISIDDAKSVSEIFNSTVINEYGMAEAGVIGYSISSLYPIKIFYKDFIARAHNQNLIITTIGQRCFPLINYDTEDLLSKESKGFLFELNNLGGKARDIFNLLDIHGKTNQTSVIILDHIFKQIDCLRSLHYKIEKDHNLCIYYSYFNEAPSQSMLMKTLKNGLLIEGIEIDPKLIKFSETSVPIKTLAGKRKAFIKDI